MEKRRKLFCERGPLCYRISVAKETCKRCIADFIKGNRFARRKNSEPLSVIWKGHMSAMFRELAGVDMRLQYNKAKNLFLAGEKINGIVIQPGEVFSFWNTVGYPTKKRGYLEGLVIKNRRPDRGTGGGLCQLSNLIHYMVLHTPLEVVESHHHSDALFPDSGRRVPFGTGISVMYKRLDYRFKNTQDVPVQIRIWQDKENLFGEIRSSKRLNQKYRLVEEGSHYRNENGVYYRCGEVYRIISSRETNESCKALVLKNHSEVLYDYSLIPKKEIRGEQDADSETH